MNLTNIIFNKGLSGQIVCMVQFILHEIQQIEKLISGIRSQDIGYTEQENL